MPGRKSWDVELRQAAEADNVASRSISARAGWLSRYTDSKSDKVQRLIRALRQANFANPTMLALRALFLHTTDTTDVAGNTDLVAQMLSAYMLGRQNRLQVKHGSPEIPIPASLADVLDIRNPVAEVGTGS